MKNTHSFNVQDYGARADGKHHDGPAIAAAIAACNEAGGGQVLFPPGTYLTGPIRLCSNLELHLETGATVLFSRDFDEYPLVITHFEGRETVACRSPISGENLRHIAITGDGIFDGQGDAWRPVLKSLVTEEHWAKTIARGGIVDERRNYWFPTEAAMRGEPLVKRLRSKRERPNIEDYVPARDFLRPNLVKLVECTDVLLDGPTFQNSPCWNVHLLFCENVTVRNVTLLNPAWAVNGDGLDIESCRNVDIYDCFLDVGDDAICLKSGKDEEGRRRNRPCENITVRDCTVWHGHGGITVGSEMSGGVRNVKVWDCVFRGTEVGLRFKTVRGRGGVVEDIDIRNITMSEISGAAISFDMFYAGTAWGDARRAEPEYEHIGETTPCFRRVTIAGVRCQGAHVAIEIRGLPEMPIEAIALEDMTMEAKIGVVLREAKDVTLRSVEVTVEQKPALDSHNVENLTLVDFKGQTALAIPAPPLELAANGTGSLNGSH